MLDFLRRIDVCGRVVRKKIKWIERRKMILEQELGRYATMEEVKEYCDLDAMDAELINGDRIVHASSCSLNYHRYAREDEESFACHEIQEGLAAPFTHPAEVMDRKELRERFEKVLTGLSPKLRQTIILFYFEGLRQSEIGKKLGVSGEAIYLRRRDALKILRQETSFCDYA
jgi:RNA polymerase sigma factor for flagellar operon FliA